MTINSMQKVQSMKWNRKSRPSRRGAVTVETAVCISLAFFLFFTALEFCRVAMIRHTVEHALYEGARKGIIPGASASEVSDQTRAIMRTIVSVTRRSPSPHLHLLKTIPNYLSGSSFVWTKIFSRLLSFFEASRSIERLRCNEKD